MQVAFAVSRRVGPAVVRNRIRRRLRHVISEGHVVLPDGAYLIGATREAATVPFPMLVDDLREAVAAVARS